MRKKIHIKTYDFSKMFGVKSSGISNDAKRVDALIEQIGSFVEGIDTWTNVNDIRGEGDNLRLKAMFQLC